MAQRRGSKSISPDDLLFLTRHDGAKLKRLKEFLNWKDIRKNVKQPEETTISNVGTTLPFEIGEVVTEEDQQQPIDDDSTDNGLGPNGLTKSNSANNLAASTNKKKLASDSAGGLKKRAYFYWDPLSSLVAEATKGVIRDFEPLDADLNAEEAKEESMRRLREADLITRNMSKTEYMEYTECRQASFTYKKAKKFRDWLGIPLSVTEYRLSDEVLEIVGFMATELVRKVTEGALMIAEAEVSASHREYDEDLSMGGLFKAPEQKSPILPRHIQCFVQQGIISSPNNKLCLY